MILRALLATALLVTAAHADFERHIAAGAQPDLYVSTGAGHIHVYPGDGNEIHVKAHVYAGWNLGNLDGRIRNISDNPPIQQSGNSIHIGESSDRNLFNNITIDYEISAPRGVALNLHTGSGDIQVDNLGRFLKADSGSGSLRAHQVAGPADLHTGSGDIELQQSAAGEVKAVSGSGSIRVNGLAGGPFTARTGSGDIEANGVLNAAANVRSGSGSIRMHLGHESHFNINAASGSGTIRVPGMGSSDAHHINTMVNGGGPMVEAHTGSGDIEIN